MPSPTYPVTEAIDVVEEHFGRRVSDPYRWLESDMRDDPRVADWIAAQNAVTEACLAALPGRAVFAERLAAALDFEQLGAPIGRGDRLFFTRRSGADDQPSLIVREGGRDRTLFDPNRWSDDGSVALGEWAPSDDGRFVALGVQDSGTDWRTIRVVDVCDGAVLADEVRWARFTLIAWAADGSGFFYSRYPEPAGGAADPAGLSGHAVWFHRLGADQSADRLVHADAEHPFALNLADRTDDGRFLVITTTPGPGVNALAVVDLTDPDWIVRPVVTGFDAEWSVIGSEGARLLLVTSDAAERRRIVTLDLDDPQPSPRQIVAEDAAVLTSAALIGGRILATCLVDAQTELRRFAPDGTPDGVVQLPGIGSAGGFQGRAADTHAFFLFSSFDTPITVCRYDVAADRLEIWAEPELRVDRERIAVEQRFVTSKDGARVPVFIVRRRDATGPTPTLLTGYGGFGISMIPVYNPAHMAWIEQGGAVATANIRGGGEYGRAWHRAGQFENRQNAFDDFIAAAEFLKAEGIAPQDGLAIHGESNGGLLVGAVVNQRPDLFAAALPGVGVMDMLRYHRFTGGMLWAGDFGSPEEERHFASLLSYSPYHNIRPGADYPAILATTADGDDRVVPGHTFKYVAALQASDLGPKPRLVRVESRAGHGAGLPHDRTIALYADMWTFAARWTGLAVGWPRQARISSQDAR
ncbi:prolyl oligopeptidase family serine peptidase [Albimonas pacifica]|uniref:prolyl oligopeptidase n=1 Tax=Albimonas pacifica TaxID=1114924 RepID=A0A1I3FTW0_9RHOB|nr:prolyl oligopeptidase family serine peptidase [Albimonas pacifica]SFI14587.1 prolyl oligopeptidase [Albimonas pacifica]